MKKKIPDKTVQRLSVYYRCLYFLSQQGTGEISSKSLADLLEMKPDQVRKDLSYFGKFGKRGSGYYVPDLVQQIAKILGLEHGRKVAVVGMGNLGTALAAYKGFEVLGFNVVATFDVSPQKIGKKIRGVMCYGMKDLNKVIKEKNIEMALLTVPPEVVQEVTSAIVAAGIKAILNFSSVTLNVPKGVKASDVDLASELKSLSYFMTTSNR
ncbi:MAG: redox-sensing transcriptional repressor Rex [Candidatus Margulisbacteria bacterium]|nr:redox-sensing transcriptional repressor Rex [Candidatus Margulisiibacteriota bacterium]